MTASPPAPKPHEDSSKYSARNYIVRLVLLLAFAGITSAQETAQAGESLTTFLEALEGSPELLAAQAAVEAAELQVRIARDPVVLEASGGYNRFDLDDALTGTVRAAQVPPGGGADTIPESGYQIDAAFTFRPYPFGDVADLVTQRELEYELRVLELGSARTGLEVRALEAALGARLAERSTKLAQEGVVAATQGLGATRLRAAKDAANARDLRGAELALLEAQVALQNARLDLETARAGLNSLVGDTPPPSYAALAGLTVPPVGIPASVAQTLVQTRQVALGISAARRELLPVASASYVWNASDYSTVTASVESRTLQPSVALSYRDPARTFPDKAVDATFQIGVSATLSLGALDALSAAERQEASAQAALAAARKGGALQESAARSAATQTGRTAELERRSFQSARLSYRENRTRQDLGLSSPLETQTSLLELLQADLARRSAELARLSALLDVYELYALPPSETL